MGVVLLLLLATQARAFALFRCEYTGTARTACCCPSEAATQAPTTSVLSKACCCHVERVEASLPPSAAAPHQLAHLAPPHAILLAAPSVRPAATAITPLHDAEPSRYVERTRAGPKTPLIIVHRRLLI